MTQPEVGGGGSTPGQDAGTKACPFCAETIRAAAIKCRYCQSDLTGTDATVASRVDPPPPTTMDDPPRATAVPPGAEDVARSPRSRDVLRSSAGSPRTRAVAAGVALVTAALFALAGWTWWERREVALAAESGQVARAAVSDKLEALLSYRHESFDDDVAAAQEMLTAEFQEQYAPTVAEIRRRALSQERNQQAEVLAVGLVSAEPDRVRTLVFVNTLSSREDADDEAPTVMQNRVLVDLVPVEEGDGWLIDDLSFPSA